MVSSLWVEDEIGVVAVAEPVAVAVAQQSVEMLRALWAISEASKAQLQSHHFQSSGHTKQPESPERASRSTTKYPKDLQRGVLLTEQPPRVGGSWFV